MEKSVSSHSECLNVESCRDGTDSDPEGDSVSGTVCPGESRTTGGATSVLGPSGPGVLPSHPRTKSPHVVSDTTFSTRPQSLRSPGRGSPPCLLCRSPTILPCRHIHCSLSGPSDRHGDFRG